MEHWQFLIQKQGARSWHILESPNLEILEGQYRVLARTNLHNTDVEVRVTHSSTQEIQPTRRIFKRSRRTNSEGLMAVIPFTYFQSGVWELRCCADLMSDLLGKSWQYSVQLQVLSQVREQVGEYGKQGENVESNSPAHPNTVSENWESIAPAEPAITFDKAIAVSRELVITTNSNPATTVLPEGNLESAAPVEPAITFDKAIAVSRELVITTNSNPATTVLPEDNLESAVPAEPAITFDKAIAVSRELAITVLPEDNLESTVPAEPAITFDKAIAVSRELVITTNSNPATTVLPEGNLESTVPAEPAITFDKAIAVSRELAITVLPEDNLESTVPAEPAITFDKAIAVSRELAITVLPEDNLESTAPAEPAITFDKAIAVSRELAITTNSNPATTVLPDKDNLESTTSVEPAITFDKAIAVSRELAITVLPEDNLESAAPVEPAITLDKAIAVSTELAITTHSNPATIVVPDETEKDIVIDEPVSPVWLKGGTAEQILQNLIDLALPASDLLPKDEKVTDSPATQLSPPLLLTLRQDTYIARWGQALTINGHIELKEKTNLDQAETLSPESLRALELEIELRSPNNSKILTKVRQPLPDQELPFTINTSIDIPTDCESKLILADINLYGRFANAGEIIRLASQSFTITADVTELLAITAAAKPSTSLNDAIAPLDSSATFTEPEVPVKLDLKLFNLVKILKTDQSQILNPSPNTALPPQINLQVLREATLRTSKLRNSGTSPQLPKLPPIQTDANIPTDVVEPPMQQELLEKDATITAINLEQLVIRQRRMPILDTTLPYLRRLQALPGDAQEVKNNVTPDALEVQRVEDLPQLDVIVAEDENTPDLVIDDVPSQEESVAEIEAQPNAQFQEEFVAEVETNQNAQFQEESVAEIETQQNSQFITTGNLYSSPLLRKWMQSQGYSLPESINDVQLQDYDNYVPAQQTPLSLSAENANIDVHLPLNLDANTKKNLSEDWNPSELLLTEALHEQGTWEEIQEFASDQENFGEDVDTAKEADLGIAENRELEKLLEEPTLSSALLTQLPPPPPPIKVNIASAWLAQEIVVDDTYSEMEADATKSSPFEEKEQALLDLSPSLPIIAAVTGPLPIPQLHVPEGELIAGKFILVRVVLPEVPPQVVVKLWLEDYQTRWLLDGPHLLTNLLPNASGDLEVMTQLNIPFGCLEIRLEAIALDLTTQQESHKITIVRTVIPPDLPNLQLDELLGM
ncbi:hypothetical protein [Nostoc sp.]|uniref:hypothetical protein n=3 Tax=Nostoc TaxID=1177 RepID=UPI002FF7859C